MRTLSAVPNNLETTIQQYLALKSKSKEIEAQISVLRGILETACIDAPDLKVNVGAYSVQAIGCEREVFNLPAAKQILGAEMLWQWITVSKYVQIRVGVLK